MDTGVRGELSTLSRASTSWEGEVQGQSLYVSMKDASEVYVVSKFISETCGCELGPKNIPCSTYLTKETIVQCSACCLELDHDELDLVVL